MKSPLSGFPILILAGCASAAPPRLLPVDRSPRDVYASGYRSDEGSLRAWEEAGRRALEAGRPIGASFSERVTFLSGEPRAVAYRIGMVRGQTLRVEVRPASGGSPVFVDVFQDLGGEVLRPERPENRGDYSLTFVARATGEFVLRLQPRVGRGGEYVVSVDGGAVLLFPVAGGGMSDIGSAFGDPRDGGVREHEGVDIFAPRGTAVFAVADGYIEKAGNTPIGGIVIWQHDPATGLRYYYAHLDELLVHRGTHVSAGDLIGRVGNTGNARGTPPHLHFGVYMPGTIALDPMPMIAGGLRAVADDRE